MRAARDQGLPAGGTRRADTMWAAGRVVVPGSRAANRRKRCHRRPAKLRWAESGARAPGSLPPSIPAYRDRVPQALLQSPLETSCGDVGAAEEAAGSLGRVPDAADRCAILSAPDGHVIMANNSTELQTIVDGRQKLESQQQENKGVQQVCFSYPFAFDPTLTRHPRNSRKSPTMPTFTSWLAPCY